MTEHVPGPSRVTHPSVAPALVGGLAALFDGLPAPQAGEPLPPLWHWVGLAAWAPAGQTGADGHPRPGDFLPDVGKPRRMFAGGSVRFDGPLVVGEPVTRAERLLSVEPKHGRQGDFVLVRVETNISSSRGHVAVRETQDLVYRDAAVPTRSEAAGPAAVSPPPQAAPPSQAVQPVVPALLHRDDQGWVMRTDPTKLMRFSAATANGHRIHYDLDYATAVEGYPGLVVHGPLITLSLLEVLRLEGLPPVHSMTHRGLRPLFCGTEARIRLTRPEPGRAELALVTDAGEHAVVAVEFATEEAP